MKQHLLLIVGTAASIAGLVASVPSAARSDETIRPASFLDVKFADSLWAVRHETNRRTTIPYVLGELKRRGSISGFAVLAGRTDETYRGYMWADSDVYKTLEGIAYSLRTTPDASLEEQAEEIIGLIVRAQAADGYLMPHLQIAEPDYTRYSQETTRTCESYSQGHLIESAVAHCEATGRREYLDAAIKTADLLARVQAEGQLEQVSGHPGVEIALVKLARATADDRYLELAKSYVANARTLGSIWSAGRPFLAHDEPAGHAVAACYLYAGATDVAALTGDSALLDLLKTKWERLAGRKMYITGGTGHPSYHEGFAPDYDLPNERAYCERLRRLPPSRRDRTGQAHGAGEGLPQRPLGRLPAGSRPEARAPAETASLCPRRDPGPCSRPARALVGGVQRAEHERRVLREPAALGLRMGEAGRADSAGHLLLG